MPAGGVGGVGRLTALTTAYVPPKAPPASKASPTYFFQKLERATEDGGATRSTVEFFRLLIIGLGGTADESSSRTSG